jgi:hypothetical protein
MKFVIDDTVCEKYNLTAQQVFILLALQCQNDKLYEDLIEKGLITKCNCSLFELNKKYSVINKGINLCNSVLLDSSKDTKKTINIVNLRYQNLAIKLRDIYPKGKMPGTSYYYKGNIEDIRKKLQSFFLRYPNYTDEQIITATQKYINSMNGDYTYLKLLKYFIWKSEVKDGEQVVTSILSDYIENEGQEDNINNDWTSELK